jgi:hypothetical protein
MQGLMNGIGLLSGSYGSDIAKMHEVFEGATVTELRVEPGEAKLALVTNRGVCVLDTEGDCCSETWFADVLGVSHLLGKPVRKVEIMDLPVPEDTRTRQESDVAYGIRLTTDAGVCDIVYRNSSNGYYGGWASLAKELPDIASWKVIADDWQA